MSYTVRFDRGNRGWTCSVFSLDGNGLKHGPTVATGTGNTQDAAREAALMATSDAGIRAALSGADPSRPHWVQGAIGEAGRGQKGRRVRRAWPEARAPIRDESVRNVDRRTP